MGTNYYRVNIPTEEDIKRMHELIDQRKFESRRGCWDPENGIIGDDVVTCVQDLIDDCTRSIHICKMSIGWKTGFDHNWGKYYQPNRKDLERFLSEPNTIIKDEYGEVISFEDFWKEVDTRDHAKLKDGSEPFDSESYSKWEYERTGYKEYICREDIIKCEEKFGVHTNSNDFTVDDLRFSVFSDFS